MAWLAVDKEGVEEIFHCKPIRIEDCFWVFDPYDYGVKLPKGSIKRLIGDQLLKTHGKEHLTWDDEPVEILDFSD
jgi:hypothetical protein